MNDSEKKLRDAMLKIAAAAQAAVETGQYMDDDNGHPYGESTAGYSRGGKNAHCSIKQLPGRLVQKAAKTAVSINPTNRVNFGPLRHGGPGSVLPPAAIAVLVGKYWGPQPRQLTVSFLDGGPNDLRGRIIEHMNAWNQTAGISFVETSGVGNVRISRNLAGYWSYLGTDILHIPSDRPTLNLQGFTMNMPESEFHRVVRHEAGHTLGFPHEHMRAELVAMIDPQKAYDFFLQTQGWDRQTVDQQVLTPLERDIDRRHSFGPGFYHVLSASGIDHEGRQSDPRGHGHQCDRLHVRGGNLPEDAHWAVHRARPRWAAI